jgi:hypothetical protein
MEYNHYKAPTRFTTQLNLLFHQKNTQKHLNTRQHQNFQTRILWEPFDSQGVFFNSTTRQSRKTCQNLWSTRLQLSTKTNSLIFKINENLYLTELLFNRQSMNYNVIENDKMIRDERRECVDVLASGGSNSSNIQSFAFQSIWSLKLLALWSVLVPQSSYHMVPNCLTTFSNRNNNHLNSYLYDVCALRQNNAVMHSFFMVLEFRRSVATLFLKSNCLYWKKNQ